MLSFWNFEGKNPRNLQTKWKSNENTKFCYLAFLLFELQHYFWYMDKRKKSFQKVKWDLALLSTSIQYYIVNYLMLVLKSITNHPFLFQLCISSEWNKRVKVFLLGTWLRLMRIYLSMTQLNTHNFWVLVIISCFLAVVDLNESCQDFLFLVLLILGINLLNFV